MKNGETPEIWVVSFATVRCRSDPRVETLPSLVPWHADLARAQALLPMSYDYPSILANRETKTRDGRQLAADLIGDAIGEKVVRLAKILEGEHRDPPEPGLAGRLPAGGEG